MIYPVSDSPDMAMVVPRATISILSVKNGGVCNDDGES